jgi:uncharacterized repeat protein (TIGR03803 family)
MTYEGGSKNLGTVFTIKTDGSEYKVLYSFGTGTNDGAFPYGSLILSGGTLYGTTYEGGQSNTGTVFAIGTNGTGYTNLYSFKGGTDGQNPPDGLALGGSILYGTTYEGGADGYGSVFSISTNGTNYSILHSFTGGSDGAYPYTKVFVSGKNLYGTTYEGGADDYGTLFTLKTTGKGFKVLHKFTDGPDGAYPANGVVVAGGKVYGMTYEGGIGGYGNIFDVSTAGSGFKVLHDFGSGTTNSAYPYQNTLILSGSILYGTTYYGGTASGDGYGTIFSLDLR